MAFLKPTRSLANDGSAARHATLISGSSLLLAFVIRLSAPIRALMAKSLAHCRSRDCNCTLLLRVGVSLALSLGVVTPSPAQAPVPRDLTEFSLEDLMNVQVTSVSKKEQKLSKTGAAIFVINQEDIRRSGALHIPGLLRMVPGLDVARIDSNKWVVSIRGFNSRFSNKVLVLIDGRSVYSPNFSGVFWEQEDVPLEDIDRIEVIRGPGGTVWGANAVNGVINIITKSAKATQGGLITAGTGSEESAQGLVQYGGKIGAKRAYRAFGRYFNVDSADSPNGGHAADGWSLSHGGFRSDWDLSPRDQLTVQGDFLHVRAGETLTSVITSALPFAGTFNSRASVDAGNALGRWNHTLLNGSDTSLQVYYSGHHRSEIGLDDSLRTADIDFQHHLHAGSRNDIVWGVAYRFTDSVILPGYAVRFVPAHRADSLYSAFLQDEIKLSNSLSLTVGSKFEHNSYTGFENEPSAQLVWTPTDKHTVWASAAKAIREPSQSDVSLQVDAAVVPLDQGRFGLVTLSGNPNAKAEQLRDFEAGYRAQVNQRLSLDFTGFLSFYKHLETAEPQAPFFALFPGPPHLVFPSIFDYQAHARDYGAEFFANWNVTDHWRLSPGLTLLNMSVVRDPGSQDSTVEQTPGYSPRRQFQVRSMLDLTHSLEWDQTIGYVSALPAGNIPAYVRLDTRFGWRLGESLEISIVGQNLLRPRHAEFPDTLGFDHTLIERSVFGKIIWHF